MQHDPDYALRESALMHSRELAHLYGDIVPMSKLREGFIHDGRRISFGSFQKGIHRAKEQRSPAALTLTTAPPKAGHDAPYDDVVNLDSGEIVYHYRQGSPDLPDNRALRAAHDLHVPLIYFWGFATGQYQVVAPVFVTADSPLEGVVLLEVGLPFMDTRGEGLVSERDLRKYTLSEVMLRYHQARFRRDVMRAYRDRCAICRLRETSLIEAAHIVRDSDPEGIAAVVNGIALCAIHHLSYDRNLLGIDPSGLVHISDRLLKDTDGPMLKAGLQGFHGQSIGQPESESERPDPERLALRFSEFTQVA